MKPYFHFNNIEIYQGHVKDVLKEMAPESVHCVVTSPPYWGLRRYLLDSAVVLRYDLSHEEKIYVRKELEKHGVQTI